MKVKSLAAGMILPLAASVALATAPVASAATPTGAAFTQSVRTDDHNGDRHGGGGGSYDRGRHGYGGGYYDRGGHGYGGGYYDRGRHGYGYGYGWISCYNPYLGWHRHSRWDRLHRWDRCNYGRYDGGYRR